MRRALAGILMTVAQLALGFALVGWWLNHTAFNPDITEDIAGAVLSNPDVNDQLVRIISANVSAGLAEAGAPIDADTIDSVVRQQTHTAGGIALLEDLVTQAHRRVIGESTAPVTITTQQLVGMFGSAAENLDPVEIPVPVVTPVSWLDRTLESTVPMALTIAIVAGVLSFLVDSDKAASLRGLGIGLLLVAGVLMVLGYLVPVYVVPNTTSSPWVEVVPQIARDHLQLLGGIALLTVGAGLAALTGAATLNRR